MRIIRKLYMPVHSSYSITCIFTFCIISFENCDLFWNSDPLKQRMLFSSIAHCIPHWNMSPTTTCLPHCNQSIPLLPVYSTATFLLHCNLSTPLQPVYSTATCPLHCNLPTSLQHVYSNTISPLHCAHVIAHQSGGYICGRPRPTFSSW